MKEISFHVPGLPIGKARARVNRRGAYTPKKSRDYEKQIAIMAKVAMVNQRAQIMTGAVEMIIFATFEPPKSWSKKDKLTVVRFGDRMRKTTKPDIDNIVKSVQDALNGVVYVDDSQITDLIARKRYGVESGIDVRVKEVYCETVRVKEI